MNTIRKTNRTPSMVGSMNMVFRSRVTALEGGIRLLSQRWNLVDCSIVEPDLLALLAMSVAYLPGIFNLANNIDLD